MQESSRVGLDRGGSCTEYKKVRGQGSWERKQENEDGIGYGIGSG